MWNSNVANEIATCYRDISSFYDVSSKLKNDLMILITVGAVIVLGNRAGLSFTAKQVEAWLRSDLWWTSVQIYDDSWYF